MRWVDAELPLFRSGMEEAISDVENARQVLGQSSPWDDDTNVSEEFLTPLFQAFFNRTGMAGGLVKSDYHFLVDHVEVDEIDPEVFLSLTVS